MVGKEKNIIMNPEDTKLEDATRALKTLGDELRSITKDLEEVLRERREARSQ